jgi:hypothetical protein
MSSEQIKPHINKESLKTFLTQAVDISRMHMSLDYLKPTLILPTEIEETIKRKVEQIEGVAPIFGKRNESFDKVVVVEVFSGFFDCSMDDPVVKHEIIGNTESAWNLARKYHSKQRFIWSLNDDLTESLPKYGSFTKYSEVINLATNHQLSEENPLNLTARSKVIIVAQGNPDEEKIADIEVEDFIALLQEDLGIDQIAELEFIVCKLGRFNSYLNQIADFFRERNSATKIVAYTTIISVDLEGEVIGFDDDDDEESEEVPSVYRWKDIDKIQKNIFVNKPMELEPFKIMRKF